MEINDNATEANQKSYNLMLHGEYAAGAPHLRHRSIRKIYENLVSKVFQLTRGPQMVPRVLDLGAGDGLATLSFLHLGACVVAVDISSMQLEQLKLKCVKYADRLEVRCEDMSKVLKEDQKYDIVVMNSVLHHIPDYMAIIESVTKVLTPCGIFMSFQDPMWKQSIAIKDELLSNVAHLGWRLGRGDVLGGIWRRLRRSFGFYSVDSIHDNTEYHAVRNGVDQLTIRKLFEERGLKCQIVEYCSLHSGFAQPWGEKLGVKNTFSIIAGKNVAP